MANTIDDQERFRLIQSGIFEQFNRELLDSSRPYDDESIKTDVLNYVLDAVKKDVAKMLMKIDTTCQYAIMFKRDVAVLALQAFYDLFHGIDDDFHTTFYEYIKNHSNEKTQKNPQE